MLNILYQGLTYAQGDLLGLMPSLVVTFFQPAAEQKWTTKLAAGAAFIGLLTFAAILIDYLTAETATPLLVAAIVGLQSTLSGVVAGVNGFNAAPHDSTYLAVDGNYSQGVIDYVQTLHDTVDGLWNSTTLGSSGLTSVLGTGSWLDVPNPMNQTGLRPSVTSWWDDIMVTSFINKSWIDNDVFILFMPYGTVGYYNHLSSYL